MKGLKRILAIVLSLLIFCGSVLSNITDWIELPDFSITASAANTLKYGDESGITRAEWLYDLTVVFDMYTEEEYLPDNYFSDLEESHTYYDAIINAVQYGVIDIPAGEALEPDAYVTRDFAASTLNFCLGYQPEQDAEYTFTDTDEVTSPDSAQIAINREWFALIEGKFAPDTLVTSEQVKLMLDDASAVLEKQVVDTGYDNTYEFTEDVIVLPEDVEASEDENGIVSITDCPETIAVNDKFAVYYNGIPVVYTAQAVTVNGNVTVIETESVETEEAFTEVDAQGVIDSGAMEIVPAEGVEVSVDDSNSGISTFAIKKTKTLKAEVPIKAGGLTGKVSVKIENPYIDYSTSGNGGYVTLNGETTVTYSISASLAQAVGLDKGLPLFSVNILGVGSFDVAVMVDFSGTASGTVKGFLTAGVQVEKDVGIRTIRQFLQHEAYTSVEAATKVSLRASLGVTKMPVISAYVYAEVGVKANFSKKTFSDDKKPHECTHFAAYLFAEYGVSASAKFGWVSYEETIKNAIYTESNSPMRVVNHYEDGNLVAKCTRGTSYSNFFTKFNSRWSGCGWMSANGAYGLNADGTYFALYDYELNENNEAIITKYNGNAWSVYIPEEIDGYTVVEIGDSAFEDKRVSYINIPDTVTTIGHSTFLNCYNLKTVSIPDSVTTIDTYAFQDCVKLENVSLPKNLVTLNGSAFANCTSLKSINIPKTIENISTSGLFDYGPFLDCSNLKTITFAQGITTLPYSLFAYCSGIEEITIPDTVTTIDSRAFYNCENLKTVSIPDSVTIIEYKLFANCINLQNITIPETITAINDSAFENCQSLKIIEIPNNVTELGAYCFSGCSSLESIVLPNTYSIIKDGSFENCTSLKAINFPETVQEIEDSAFYGCSALKEAILPESTKTIGTCAFQNCTYLEKVVIPQSTKTIGTQAFMGCESLKDVSIADYTIKKIESNTFKDCPALESIVLPKGLTTIGSQAFMNNTALVGVTIPESVTSIDSTAFSYPLKTTIYGKTGSYAETFANEGGFTFKDISIPVEGIILKDGIENVTLDQGKTYRAEFEVYPEDANDVITLTANNSNVTINGHDIYARYAGDTVITATSTSGLTYEFNLHIRSVKSIAIINNPNKTTYVLGEEFDKTGMSVQVNYYDDSSKIIDDYTISGFDSSLEGENIVTIKWVAANGSTYSTYITLNIVDTRPKLTGIFIDTMPDKLTYALRERLDTTGLVVKGTYTDESSSVITGYTVTGYNALKKGEQTITISYEGFTATFTVTVGQEPEHTHSYTVAKYDVNGHWNECTCGAKDEVKQHSYDNACDNSCDCGYTRAVPAHDYADATCTAPKTCKICGVTSGSKLSHKSDSGTVTKKATCTATGIKTYKCTLCSSIIKTNTIAKVAHKYDSGKVTKAATCKATGVKTYTCSVCNGTKTEVIAKTTAHKYTTTTTKATLSKNGSIVKKCTVCGKVASTTAIRYAKTFQLSTTTYTYDGKVKTPSVIVKDSAGTTLKKNIDYAVSYASGRKNVGTYKIIVRMIGKYSGTKTLAFKIKPATIKSYKLSAAAYVYNGKVKTPSVVVKDSAGRTLKKNVDYTVVYASGRKNVGIYKVAIKGKGNYAGAKVLTFRIIPRAASINKLTAKSKAIYVNLNRVLTQSTGYQVQYSTSKTFVGAKTKTITNYKTSALNISGLKAKTIYFVRVRTFKKVGSLVYYSGWSTYKYIKTK